MWPSWAHLGPSWPRLGASSGRLGASCGQLGFPKLSQKRSKIHPKLDKKSIQNRCHLGTPKKPKIHTFPRKNDIFINPPIEKRSLAPEPLPPPNLPPSLLNIISFFSSMKRPPQLVPRLSASRHPPIENGASIPSPSPLQTSPLVFSISSLFSLDETSRAAPYLRVLRQALPVIRQPSDAVRGRSGISEVGIAV